MAIGLVFYQRQFINDSILIPICFELSNINLQVKISNINLQVLVYAPLTAEQEEYYKSSVEKTIQDLLEDREELPQDLLGFKEVDDDDIGGVDNDGKEDDEEGECSNGLRRPKRHCTDGNDYRVLGGFSPTKEQKKAKQAVKKIIYADESSDEEGKEEEKPAKKSKGSSLEWFVMSMIDLRRD